MIRNKLKSNLDIPVNDIIFVVLEAKCPECGRRAEVDDDMTEVKCKQCGFHALYEEYIEIMKGKAVNMADDFQMNWDRRPV